MMTDLNTQIDKLLEVLKTDYLGWHTDRHGSELNDISKTMVDEFNNRLEVEYGTKYAKVISNRSVWGFVVLKDNDKKFKQGDILKAAGWKGPARNFARGNVMTEEFDVVRWCGV